MNSRSCVMLTIDRTWRVPHDWSYVKGTPKRNHVQDLPNITQWQPSSGRMISASDLYC